MLDAPWTWLLPAACGLAAGLSLRPMAAGWVFDALILLLASLLLRALLDQADLAGARLLNPYALTLGFAVGQCLRAARRSRHGHAKGLEDPQRRP